MVEKIDFGAYNCSGAGISFHVARWMAGSRWEERRSLCCGQNENLFSQKKKQKEEVDEKKNIHPGSAQVSSLQFNLKNSH